jgi:hypothetical protein
LQRVSTGAQQGAKLVAFKNVVVPWLSGGALLLGYATFAWLRGRKGPIKNSKGGTTLTDYEPEPLSDQLERVPDAFVTDSEEQALPANSNGLSRQADLGALFLGRAASALSPFQSDPNRMRSPR